MEKKNITKTSLISIVIPVFNIVNYIERCVFSVIKQSYKNIEIILVDDGSTDGSALLCDKIGTIDSRIKVLHKVNGGLSSARNEGIKAANGEYISFIDGDDYILPTMIETLYLNLINNKADISICGFKQVRDNESEDTRFSESETVVSNSPLYDFLVNDFCVVNVWNRLYKKTLFDSINFPNGLIYEDLATSYKIFDQCKTVVKTDSQLYCYVQRDNSIMGQTRYKIRSDKFKILEEMWSFLLAKNEPKFLRKVLTYLLNDIYRLVGSDSLRNNKEYLSLLKLFVNERKTVIAKFHLLTKKESRVLFVVFNFPRLSIFLYNKRHSK